VMIFMRWELWRWRLYFDDDFYVDDDVLDDYNVEYDDSCAD
jgi:hypothetical protein